MRLDRRHALFLDRGFNSIDQGAVIGIARENGGPALFMWRERELSLVVPSGIVQLSHG